MSSYGRNFSTRLFVQAAFTACLAPIGGKGSTWLAGTFALALVAAVLGAVVRGGHERTREMVIGFEAVAVAVGVFGLTSHHYIPATIAGIAALVTAVNHPMPACTVTSAVAVPAQPVAAEVAAPAAPVTGVRAMNILPGR